ncbi:type I-G CRISPR-associated helicase/endonuclease Cas3g [Tahibacter caeni]|uniref:type I-G CRISPR-associated helicase/endonuclease Cas3g n=1 Tax=Tahibacter caeni TaxID=1453545 RepID=UPI002147BED0|nr:type I-U CRISPR-associated helicase/endonuclease Cas3 [Tahibacter caeni]
MTELDFDAFFAAVHGKPPLPWQSRLARTLRQTHRWPGLVDLPTASGKTACIDIALFHLAACAAAGTPWLAARRIVFAVDRRLIVDSAHERALTLQRALDESTAPAVRAVAAALKTLGSGEPLHCLKLRGGMSRERGFAYHPCQPMIVSSTIDQIGSRLLFRGYGLSRYSQPLHAGLLGHDTLILLDEAHLSAPFIGTVAAIQREQARAEAPPGPVRPVVVVPLSATAQADGERFRLDADDLANPLIARRRTASKPARLVEAGAKPAERVKAIVAAVAELRMHAASPVPTLAVMVNRVATARQVYEQLVRTHGGVCQVELATGRNRPLAREAISARLIARCAAGREPRDDDRPIVVVATQTLEVGADLDFDGLVTECASLAALRQRFGRLDRLGNSRQAAAVIVGGGESDNDPVYGPALVETWQWLTRAAQRDGGDAPTVDFSIAAMEALLADSDTDLAELDPPPRDRLRLTPAHVELLCQTSPPPQYDPDVAALLHGLDTSPADVQIVWRSDLPLDDTGTQIDDTETALVGRLLALRPPQSLESLALPLGGVRAWLQGVASDTPLVDVEGADIDVDDTGGKPGGRLPAPRRAWRRERDNEWRAVDPARIRPGDTLVVPAAYGGCDALGYAPDATSCVDDLAMDARRETMSESIAVVTPQFLATSGTLDEAAIAAAWDRLKTAPEEATADELRDLLRAEYPPDATPPWLSLPIAETLLRQDDSFYALVLRSGDLGQEDLSDEDISSSQTIVVTLPAHNAGVGRRARALGAALGFDADLCKLLHAAGRAHDLGKADPRFQRLLRAGDDATAGGQLLAKGLRRHGALRDELGERHEAYSVALAMANPALLAGIDDTELALYLIGTHHGRGRALMPDKPDDGTRLTVTDGDHAYLFDGAPRLGALGSGWPDRFWRLVRRYGPWGLAYLEAVLRLADHLQSRDELAGGAHG